MRCRNSTARALGLGVKHANRPLLDTRFLVEFEDELASERPGPAAVMIAARRKMPVAVSIITLGEFAEGFLDPVAELDPVFV